MVESPLCQVKNLGSPFMIHQCSDDTSQRTLLTIWHTSWKCLWRRNSKQNPDFTTVTQILPHPLNLPPLHPGGAVEPSCHWKGPDYSRYHCSWLVMNVQTLACVSTKWKKPIATELLYCTLGQLWYQIKVLRVWNYVLNLLSPLNSV